MPHCYIRKSLGTGALQLKGLGSSGQSDLVSLFCFPFSVSLTSRFSDYLRPSVSYLFIGPLSVRSVGSHYRMRLPTLEPGDLGSLCLFLHL